MILKNPKHLSSTRNNENFLLKTKEHLMIQKHYKRFHPSKLLILLKFHDDMEIKLLL